MQMHGRRLWPWVALLLFCARQRHAPCDSSMQLVNVSSVAKDAEAQAPRNSRRFNHFRRCSIDFNPFSNGVQPNSSIFKPLAPIEGLHTARFAGVTPEPR